MDPAGQRIRDKLWYGILPNVRPLKTRGGHGTGHKLCDGCDATIWPKEAEQEVELEGGRTLRFHVACAGLWQVLRSALPRFHAKAGVSMSATTILAGILRKVQPEAIMLAAGTRIALPPDLSAKDVPVGASVLVTVTRSERGEWTARRIEHESRRNGRGR